MQHVYMFEDARADMTDVLGNKGAQLGEMQSIGIPIPPGFVISTRACVALDCTIALLIMEQEAFLVQWRKWHESAEDA